MNHCSRRVAGFVGVACALLSACATPNRRLSIAETNDLFSSGAGRDRDYSQGLVVRYEADSEGGLAAFGRAALTPLHWLDPLEESADRPREVQLRLEQRIYHPVRFDAFEFIPDERPFLGLLTLGFESRHAALDPDPSRRRDWLYRASLDVGVTGEGSLGEEAQSWVHELLDEVDPNGWDNQIDDEPVVQLGWELTRRSLYGSSGSLEWDSLPRVRAELGNVFTNLQTGIDLRLGRHLPRDRGPWRAAVSPLSVYGVVGGNFRLALHDITLDDSLFGDNDPAIVLDREPAVWQWNFQLVAEWQGFTLGYRFLRQTKEYAEEVGLHDQGTIWLGYRYVF